MLDSNGKGARIVSELYGWMGKILRADLTNRTLTTEDTEKYVPKY